MLSIFSLLQLIDMRTSQTQKPWGQIPNVTVMLCCMDMYEASPFTSHSQFTSQVMHIVFIMLVIIFSLAICILHFMQGGIQKGTKKYIWCYFTTIDSSLLKWTCCLILVTCHCFGCNIFCKFFYFFGKLWSRNHHSQIS